MYAVETGGFGFYGSLIPFHSNSSGIPERDKNNNYWHTFWSFAYCVPNGMSIVYTFPCALYQSIFITLNTQCHV